MKTIKLTKILLPLLVLYGCNWEMPCSITGNGHVVTEERHVSDFNGISVSRGINVYIAPGDEGHLEVVADENIMEVLKTEVKDNVLNIYTTENVCKTESRKVYVKYLNLNTINVSSAGDVRGEGILNTAELNIDLSSAGSLDLNAEAEKINISVSSSGNAVLSGKTGYLKAELSSAGDLNAFDLEAGTGNISVSSAGNAQVFITGEASFESSSAGDIIYKGDPAIKYMSTSSGGSIKKK
jgi:hypothetical protein